MYELICRWAFMWSESSATIVMGLFTGILMHWERGGGEFGCMWMFTLCRIYITVHWTYRRNITNHQHHLQKKSLYLLNFTFTSHFIFKNLEVNFDTGYLLVLRLAWYIPRTTQRSRRGCPLRGKERCNRVSCRWKLIKTTAVSREHNVVSWFEKRFLTSVAENAKRIYHKTCLRPVSFYIYFHLILLPCFIAVFGVFFVNVRAHTHFYQTNFSL